MERMNCSNCNQPTMHQDKDFSGNSIHGAPRCLRCGKLHNIEVVSESPFGDDDQS